MSFLAGLGSLVSAADFLWVGAARCSQDLPWVSLGMHMLDFCFHIQCLAVGLAVCNLKVLPGGRLLWRQLGFCCFPPGFAWLLLEHLLQVTVMLELVSFEGPSA